MTALKKIWENKYLIWEGLINRIFKKNPVEVIARKRLYICKACPLIDTEGKLCAIPGTHPCCGECGCSLSLKLRSMDSSCPHPDGPKWKEEKL